jgi:hypothetical protein
MDKKGLLIGIIGGFGLGLLLGREFSESSYVTYLGAILILVSIIAMGYLSIKSKK